MARRFLIEVPDDSVGIVGLAVAAAAKAAAGDLAPAESPLLWGIPRRDGCTDPSMIGLLPWESSPALGAMPASLQASPDRLA